MKNSHRILPWTVLTILLGLSTANCGVQAVYAPKAGFIANPTSGKIPLPVTFTDQSTGSPTGWSWNFGDSAVSAEKNPNHTYNKVGTYTVSLAASNTGGADTLTKSNYITVTDTITAKPTAAFTATPDSGTVPLSVTFTDQSTGNPTAWSWNFGDLAETAEKNPPHQYTKVGSFTVKLVVRNSLGSDSLTKSNYITVTDTSTALQYDSITTQGITLKWATKQGLLYVILSAPTTGWLGVGFNPTSMKKNANLIIGYVKQGVVSIQDNFGTTHTAHQSDVSLGGNDNVTNKAGTEAGGNTEISFAIPLDSGDQYDRALVTGQTYPIILAYAPNGADNFNSMHSMVTSTSIEIK